MRSTAIVTTITALFSSTYALQAIIVGNKENTVTNDLPGGHLAGYFIDSSPCDPANVATFGWSRGHTPLCFQVETNPNFTIQGVSGLTFIGCPEMLNAIPTGIAENGIPSLNCTLNSGLPKIECPLDDGSVNVFNGFGSYFLCE